MKATARKEKISEILFGLSATSTKWRNIWRYILPAILCLILGTINTKLNFMGGVPEGRSRVIVTVINLLKYIPILFIVNKYAHGKAARYLNDIYEIENDKAALNFIESVAFGHSGGRLGMKNMGYDAKSGTTIKKLAVIYNEGKITIKDGKLLEEDRNSPVILIGGPGLVQVGLDHLAVFEDVNGRPNIFHPRDQRWKIGKYERIREIGERHQYAIINLRDQFIEGISVKSRTKDGIPIEAQDIKIIFSVLRKQPKDNSVKDIGLLYDPESVKALVYGQTMITSDVAQTFGTTFPWDSTLIPLIISEIENIITSRPLNEVLANIGQKEVEAQAITNQSIETIKVEITGQQRGIAQLPEKVGAPQNFESRSLITSRFYEPEFVKKAENAGIHLQWIDIGTWKLSSDKIMEKHKDAWNRSQDNAMRRMKFEKTKNKKTQKEFSRLVDETIIQKYENIMGPIGANQLEDEEKEEESEYYMEVKITRRQRREEAEKHPEILAIEILKTFRKELSAANKNTTPANSANKADAVENALHHINTLVSPHYVGIKQNR